VSGCSRPLALLALGLVRIACAAEPAPDDAPMQMSAAQMSAMQMSDSALFGALLVDQLEVRALDTAAFGWHAEGWYGGDLDKLWVRTEGVEGPVPGEGADLELLWDRVIGRWWSLQAGAREDVGTGPARSWGALGVQGLTPYWFQVEATLYAGDAGRTAARLRIEYELLITQRLILQPLVETDLYGKSDPARRIGSGLSEIDAGLRLRYEVRREFAPYVGLDWVGLQCETATLARVAGKRTSLLQLVAGLRVFL
jgi:copper resistance protein B